MTISTSGEASQIQGSAPVAAAPSKKDDGGFSFHDLLEVINPLQHIPVVSTIYRELTGDTISPAARIAGDAMYGGWMGLASSVINEVVEGTTGKDIGGHIWATLFGDDDDDAKAAAATASSETANASAAADASTIGLPTSLLPNAAASAPVPIGPAANATATATGPVTPLNGPTSFFQTLQRGGHSAHAVPLNTTVPIGDAHHDANEALLKAQQNGQQNTQTPAAGLGTTGLAPATVAPATIPPAPPLSSGPPVVAPANISDLMMKGLDQYKALAMRQNNTAAKTSDPTDGVPATALID